MSHTSAFHNRRVRRSPLCRSMAPFAYALGWLKNSLELVKRVCDLSAPRLRLLGSVAACGSRRNTLSRHVEKSQILAPGHGGSHDGTLLWLGLDRTRLKAWLQSREWPCAVHMRLVLLLLPLPLHETLWHGGVELFFASATQQGRAFRRGRPLAKGSDRVDQTQPCECVSMSASVKHGYMGVL